MARGRAGRGNKRRAAPSAILVQTPAAMPQSAGSVSGLLPPLPRTSSSSSSASASASVRSQRDVASSSDGSLDDLLQSHNGTSFPPPGLRNRLTRTRSASSTVSTKSTKSTSSKKAIAPPAFLQVLHDANAPVIGVDVEGIVTLWNNKVASITGFDASEVVGQSLQDYIVGASRRDAVERSVALAFQDRTSTLEVTIPLRTLNGRNAMIVTSVTPLLSDDGTPLGVYGIGQDVTEHRFNEAHYVNVIMQANAPIIELDQDANISVWNAKAESLTGFVDVVGTPVLDMVDDVFREEVSKQIQLTLTGVAGGNFELPLITATGSRVEIAVCMTPREDATGAVVGVVAIGQDVTERKAKEMEYRKFIDSANAPIFGVDLEGGIVIFNKKAAETSEYTPEEVMGRNLIETLVADEFRSTLAAVFDDAFKGIETANVEIPVLTKSGRKVEILVNATPRYDHLGKLCGAIGIAQDITNRIIQEQEYSRLIDTANAPIFGVDLDFKVVIWNKKAANITQYAVEETLGEDLLQYIAAEHRTAVRELLSKGARGIESANFEFSLVTKAGRHLDILLNATPKYDHFGNICGVVGIGQDISDRRTQEQEYQRLIDTANAPIFGVDREGRVNIWNRKAAQITEYSNFDVLGANLVENFIPAEYKKKVGDVLASALEGVETANFDFPLITRNGRRVEILLNATPRHDEKGAIIGVVGIGQDITVRIAQEQEYQRLIDTANAPIFGIDMKGCVNIWNKKAAEITQFSYDEVFGSDLVNGFVSEENRATVGFALRKALQGAQTANFDFPLITKTGRRVEILLNATPRYNELGNIVGVVGIGQDITERIAQEQEYSRLIDTANAPIFGVDEQGLVNIWNKKAAAITQFTQSDVMGKNLVEEFIREDFRDAVGRVLSKALDGVETANFEFPLMTKSGRRVEILLNATPRFNEHGKVIGMVGIGQDITDRIAQEQEYSRLIDSANAPIFGVDAEGKVNIWNKKAAEITQFTQADVVGKNLVEEFIREDYRDAVGRVLSQALNGAETANFEFPLMTKSGRRVEILLNATSRFNEHGKVIGMVGIGQDITDRIAQEQEYSRLIDSANAPIFGVDERGLVNIWNKKAAEITQYTTSDVMGKNLVEEFITEDYRHAVALVLSKALGGVETANFEFPLMTKTGRRVEILLNATSRFNEHGKVIGMVGIGQDITDRIAQEQEYSRLIDSANAPIFGVDEEGKVNIWNKKAAEITQFTQSDVVGKNLVEEFIREDYRDAVRRVLSKALVGVETANFEFPLMTKTGRRVEILLNATSRFNEHGKVIGMVGIGQDITDRIAQEQEYSRLIDSANAPIFGVDEQGLVNIWNKKAAEITQYTTSDVMGKNLVEEFITEDYRHAVALVLSKALDGAETANFEFPLMTKAGRRVEILLNATSRFNEHGKVIGMVGIGQDITDRLAQEHEYTRLIDTANAPIFGVDQEGKVNIWNKKAAAITQFSQSDVMGKNLVEEFITEDYRAAVSSVLSQALDGAETANFEFPLMTKSGRRVEILLNATPRFNEHGKVIGMVGIGQDITDRIAQEQEYSRLIDSANAPIFGVNQEGKVNIWNKKAAEITQYTTSDVMGKNLVEEFITEDYRDAVALVLSKALDGVETANFEFPLMTKTGRRVEILLNATSRFNEHGKVIGMVGIGQDITDRIAQEQEYSRLIDTANAPIFGVDEQGLVNIWNKKAAAITQFTQSDVMGENLVEEFIREDFRDAVGRVLSKALAGAETANFEFPLMTKAGRRVEILLNATPRFNEHGKVIGMVGIGQDITDRIAQEEEYSRLIDTANAPIFGVDANMCVTIWNKKAAQITNYSIHEVIGENLVETFISPEYRPAVADVLTKALAGIHAANFEFPLITRPGTRIDILLNATPRMDSNGNIVGVVGIGQDITDRIAQEHAYFRLIDSAGAPIFGVDSNGCINEWNKKIEAITGYHKSTVFGMSLINTLIIPESRMQVGQKLNQALIGIDVGEMELPMTSRDGVFLLLLVNASSKKDIHGNIRGVIGVGQDYTARKHMEQAKVNFLASFSHELRTPLNGVLGMLELLKEQKLDSVSERHVHIAYVSGSLLLNLINDILDLSKIEAGHMEISSAPFHMQDLLDYSIEIFSLKARERGLRLEQICDSDVPSVVIGDVFRLRQVLLNLLSNAVKFTNSGSIVVSCSRYKPTKENEPNNVPRGCVKLLFQVADSGVGMDAEERSRLFSLFTKLERTRQNNPTGSGLGLAICKQLVELMDGTIDVVSELGQGSNFFFTVVVQEVDGQDERKSSLFGSDDLVISSNSLITPGPDSSVAPAISSNESNPESIGRLVVVPAKARILVVEDNDFNWEVFKCFLQEDDHLLQWEMNGRNAVNAYIQNHASYDLIFMDCEMPVMDGYAATTMIRQFEQEKELPNIPILGLTAYAMNGDRQKCLDAGMDEFMVKPISKMTLRRAIRQWMKVRYLGAQKPTQPSSTTKVVASSAPSSSASEGAKISSSASVRDSFNGSIPSLFPTTGRESIDEVEDDARSVLVTPPRSARLVPASQHMQQLDLTRAIANLELDNPIAGNRRGGRSVRTATPSTSIFSIGTPLSTSNHPRSSSGSLLTFQRDASGAIVEIPDWGNTKDVTSNTLPTGKSSPLYEANLRDQITVKRASYPKTPMIWNQELMKPIPSPIAVDMLSHRQRRDSGSSTDDDQDADGHESDHEGEMPPLMLAARSPAFAKESFSDAELPGRARNATETISPMSPNDIEIPDGDPVNYALGVEQCGEREELFLDLLEKFALGCESAMARIDGAFERKELILLKRESHSLKGSSAYVAALRVSKAAYRVQLACERALDQCSNKSGSIDLSRVDPLLVESVNSCMTRLRREHKLLRGYISRNFAFRIARGGAAKDERVRERQSDSSGCVVM